jgi:hypothetical protein
VLPLSVCRKLFNNLAGLKMDFKFFAEVRAIISESIIKQMKNAGLEELQIGIEALSTSLLRRMNKGTRVIDNIQIMKICEMYGIVNASNLLIQFPQSTVAEVEETLENLEFVRPFRPLRPVRFWLGLESPVWCNPKKHGLSVIFNHPNYRYLFPSSLINQLTFTIQGYRGDIQAQRLLWKPVVKKVNQWRKDYMQMVHHGSGKPLLHFRDGRTFLIIEQHRPNDDPLKHRLTSNSRKIYLFCQKPRSFKRISSKFSYLSQENIQTFLNVMVSKRLMFEEKECYLSLAVPLRIKSAK